MYIVTKDLQDFSYAHRLGKGYEKLCRFNHGHNAQVQVTLGTDILNQYDMAIDFGDIKKYLNTWVQENWDHATIVSESDTALLKFLRDENQRHYVIPADQNSTVEFMSKFLFEKFTELIREKVGDKVKVLEVKVWETRDSFATYRG